MLTANTHEIFSNVSSACRETHCKSQTADWGWANTTVVTNSNTHSLTAAEQVVLNAVRLSATAPVCLPVSLFTSAVCSVQPI